MATAESLRTLLLSPTSRSSTTKATEASALSFSTSLEIGERGEIKLKKKIEEFVDVVGVVVANFEELLIF